MAIFFFEFSINSLIKPNLAPVYTDSQPSPPLSFFSPFTIFPTRFAALHEFLEHPPSPPPPRRVNRPLSSLRQFISPGYFWNRAPSPPPPFNLTIPHFLGRSHHTSSASPLTHLFPRSSSHFVLPERASRYLGPLSFRFHIPRPLHLPLSNLLPSLSSAFLSLFVPLYCFLTLFLSLLPLSTLRPQFFSFSFHARLPCNDDLRGCGTAAGLET